jgi:hypothetical protein
MTKARTRTRTKNRLRKRTKTRSARGGVYTSFPPSDLKKETEAIKYEKFGKNGVGKGTERTQGTR